MRNVSATSTVLGALGAALCSVCTWAGTGCAGDLNGDGQVDGADLGALLSQWGNGGSGDLNGDGVVDGGDLGTLLAGWGSCGVQVTGISPPSGGPGTTVIIEGFFPSSDPFDYCVVGVPSAPLAGEDFVNFMPFEVLEVVDNQQLVAVVGPLPDASVTEVMVMVQLGLGGPVDVENLFAPTIGLAPTYASFGCWNGGPNPGPPAPPIPFIIDPQLVAPFGNCLCPAALPGLCNYACYGLKLGLGGPGVNALCTTVGPGPLPGGAFPAGTKFRIFPRFHTCTNFYVHDYAGFTITLNANAGINTVGNFIAAQLQLYVDNCDPALLSPIVVTSTPLAGGQVQLCMSIPNQPACKGNLFVCAEVPDVPPGGSCP